MDLRRIVRHLCVSQGQVTRVFPPATVAAIGQAITASEATHAGEIRFVVEGALDGAPLFKGQTAHGRALHLFSKLRLWDTEHNSGVLIYLLLADRAVEIVADRGVHAKAGASAWVQICRTMELAFRAERFEGGALGGIEAVTRHLAQHFPAAGTRVNEQPDQPLLL